MSRTSAKGAEAVAKYKEFHRYDPKTVGEFPASFRIPERMHLAGPAVNVRYRSAKVDPETLRRPRRPVDYIHDHDAGVMCYVTCQERIGGVAVDVPRTFVEVDALTRLGYCLGFCFESPDGERCEAEGTAPLPDLYATPDGKCLLVIQGRKTVLAMMWGGALGVHGRGIDG